MIEKHITQDRSLKGIDYYSSLNPDEMGKFVKLLKNKDIPYGEFQINFGKEEQAYRKKMKKQLVAVRDLEKGVILKEEDVIYKRTEENCYPLYSQNVIGKKVIHPIKMDGIITLSEIEQIVGILIIARFKSERLPGKALIPILGKPALEYLIERAKLCKEASSIILCTTTNQEDDQMEKFAESQNIKCFRGSEKDVLSRMIGACEQEQLDIAVRITGDDILLSHEHLDSAVNYLRRTNADYCHNKDLPPGCECEVFTTTLLKTIYQFARYPENTEYLTYFIENESFFKSKLEVSEEYKRKISLTLDTQDDLKRITFLLRNVYNDLKPYTQAELTCFLDSHRQEFEQEVIKDKRRARESIDCSLDFSKK